jgi:hypothetical protein
MVKVYKLQTENGTCCCGTTNAFTKQLTINSTLLMTRNKYSIDTECKVERGIGLTCGRTVATISRTKSRRASDAGHREAAQQSRWRCRSDNRGATPAMPKDKLQFHPKSRHVGLATRGGRWHEQHSMVPVMLALPLVGMQHLTQLHWPCARCGPESSTTKTPLFHHWRRWAGSRIVVFQRRKQAGMKPARVHQSEGHRIDGSTPWNQWRFQCLFPCHCLYIGDTLNKKLWTHIQQLRT